MFGIVFESLKNFIAHLVSFDGPLPTTISLDNCKCLDYDMDRVEFKALPIQLSCNLALIKPYDEQIKDVQELV